MFDGLFTDLVDFNQDLFRNIATCNPGQDLFDDLSDDPEDWSFAIGAETASASWSPQPLIERPFDYGTVISFPYMMENWQQTRFSDGLDFGVWYGSLSLKTTLYETCFHWIRFIRDSFPDYEENIVADRRVFLARVKALLVDLQEKTAQFPALLDKNDYNFTHAVGRYVHEQNQNGLLTQSARHEGINAAIFKAKVLSNIRDYNMLSYHWQPTSNTIQIKRQSILHHSIHLEELLSQHTA